MVTVDPRGRAIPIVPAFGVARDDADIVMRDSGAFEISARAPSGTRIEVTEALINEAEKYIRKVIPKEDLDLIVSDIGLTADWSAAYTQNSGPMDVSRPSGWRALRFP